MNVDFPNLDEPVAHLRVWGLLRYIAQGENEGFVDEGTRVFAEAELTDGGGNDALAKWIATKCEVFSAVTDWNTFVLEFEDLTSPVLVDLDPASVPVTWREETKALMEAQGKLLVASDLSVGDSVEVLTDQWELGEVTAIFGLEEMGRRCAESFGLPYDSTSSSLAESYQSVRVRTSEGKLRRLTLEEMKARHDASKLEVRMSVRLSKPCLDGSVRDGIFADARRPVLEVNSVSSLRWVYADNGEGLSGAYCHGSADLWGFRAQVERSLGATELGVGAVVEQVWLRQVPAKGNNHVDGRLIQAKPKAKGAFLATVYRWPERWSLTP